MTAFFGRLFVGDQFDEIVDSKNCDGRFGGEFEALDLADGGFEDSRLEIVPDDALDKIESDPLERRVLFLRLRRVVEGSEFGDKLRRVFSRVGRQHFGNDYETLGEFGDGQLLATSQRRRQGLQVDAQSGLDASAAGYDRLGLQGSLDDAEGVVETAFHLLAEEVVGASDDDGCRRPRRRLLEQDELVVAHVFLADFRRGSQHRRVERLLALQLHSVDMKVAPVALAMRLRSPRAQ